GNDVAAVRALERAARHDTDFLPEILPLLRSAYERMGDGTGARNFLAEMTEHYRGIAPVLALTRLLEAEKGTAAARAYLTEQLKDRPSVRGEAALIELTLAEDDSGDPVATLQDLKLITEQLLVRNPSYRCSRCGFAARSHHWQCPGGKEWGTIEPLLSYAVVGACRARRPPPSPGSCCPWPWPRRARGWPLATHAAAACSTSPASAAATSWPRRAAAAFRSPPRCCWRSLSSDT